MYNLGPEPQIWAKKGQKMAKNQNIKNPPYDALDIIACRLRSRQKLGTDFWDFPIYFA